MDEEKIKLIKGDPAPYPATASAELESKNIFQNFLDTRFIKGEINVMDKYPNSDGILEMTDAEQRPLGRIDIQLKTLQPRNYAKPSYQCERSFFAYCEISSLPVILVVVNRQDKKAYWRHIDRATLMEVSQNMTGESYSLSIPVENCIDDGHKDYVSFWTQKTKEAGEKVWNYDSLNEQKKILENQLKDLSAKLENPTHLSLQVLKEIHIFLDHYNYILDREFAAVKQVLYPDYWKIGIGIIKYEYGNIRFLLYPVPFQKAQTMVKEVKNEDYEDLSREMSEGNILLLASLITPAKIRETPIQYAYQLLESSIVKVAGKYNFPIADNFVAHEYLISFIDRFNEYLDMDKGLQKYSLSELRTKLYSVLPMLVATTHNFADWVTEINHNIDSYYTFRAYANHKKQITDSKNKVKERFIPKVKVTIISELYNISLVAYYISWLEQKGITAAERKFEIEQYNKSATGVDFWKTWNKKVLWSNVKMFIQQFYRLYDAYIKTNFPYIQNSLQLTASQETTIVYIFHFEEGGIARPYMEVYHFRPSNSQKGEILCFLSEDPQNPIDRKKMADDQYNCIIDGSNYEMILMYVQTLEFMFKISPTYALINDKLSIGLKKFFSEKKRKL